MTISFSFQIKKEKVKNFRKKIQNAKSRPENLQSGNTTKLGCYGKKLMPDSQSVTQKINRVRLVPDKVFFCR